MLSNVKVPIPEKNVYYITRGKNNVCYVYYILKAYGNKKGQPTSDAVIIGKKDSRTKLLIPNDNYFDIFDCEVIINCRGLKKWQVYLNYKKNMILYIKNI